MLVQVPDKQSQCHYRRRGDGDIVVHERRRPNATWVAERISRGKAVVTGTRLKGSASGISLVNYAEAVPTP